ncbi:MAG: sn-glycerol-3-phosphate ABC transporter ATP-binding protein UgpC [Geminicoccaceae bacterium]
MADIHVSKLRKSFGPVDVIKGVDLDIKSREFIVFVGPSGCGKSTLLRLVAGLEEATSGDISIDNRIVNDLPPSERGIAMVFQSYALYPHMTVYDNMAFGLRLAKAEQGTIEERVRNAARILQMEHLLERRPKELSGGQRQRVAIGRAIVRDPRVFLFDEPLSNLDAALRVQMRVEIAKLHHELTATMIYVTHDQVEAMTLADRIVVLDGGTVRQFGSPLDLYQHPDNKFVAAFIGSPRMNFVPVQMTDDGVKVPGGSTLKVPANGKAQAGDWSLGLRPEHLLLGGGGDGEISGKIITVEQLGAESYVYVDAGLPEMLIVKTHGSPGLHANEPVRVGIPAGACYLFDPTGRCEPRAAFG